LVDATRIDYTWRSNRFTLERDPERGWGVTAPPLNDADQGVISWFLSSLKNAEAQFFLEESGDEFGLDQPEVQIRISYAGSAPPMDVRIVNRPDAEGTPAYYAGQQDSGDIMRIDTRLAQSLLLDASSFRSRQLFSFDRHQSVLVSLTFEAQEYRFEKVHGQWQVRQPENATLANQSDVERILEAVARLEATGIERVDTGEDLRYGLTEPKLVVEVTTAPDGADARDLHGPLRVGELVADSLTERYARVAGREGVFRVSQDLITTVRAALEGVQAPVGN
jgi:hypothetical protein